MDCDLNLQRCHEYIEALEEERCKIQVFHRELPLCLDLVTQAIFTCRQQLSEAENNNNSTNRQSECSVQTTASEEARVLEEFIPIKPISSSDSDDREEDEDEEQRRSSSRIDDSPKDTKSDWLRSAQLWNQIPDQPPRQDGCLTKSSLTEEMRNGSGAFKPFRGEIKNGGAASNPIAKSLRTAPAVATATTAVAAAARNSGSQSFGEGSRRDEKDGDALLRKTRRCWSPELHRRFLQALEQLGGAHVATPKQIRDLMKVEGLTNDEVKSHLQKYRLHTRRPGGGSNTSVRSNTSSDPQAAQFVLLGGIWVQPPEYAGAPASASSSGDDDGAATNKIYKPAAALPPSSSASATGMQLKGENSGSRGSHSDSGRCFSPPTASSSTHTTTASPVF